MVTRPRRILHLAAGNLYGGVEVLLVTLARQRERFTRTTASFALCFEGRLARELTAAGSEPIVLGPARVRAPWNVLRARRRLSRALGRFDVVICHSAWSHAMFAPVVRRARLPLVTFLHNEASGRHWLERWAARTPPDLVVCNSEFTRRGAPLAFPGAPSAVWYPAVAIDTAGAGDVRGELGVKGDDVLIVQASRFERLKGHERHLRALATLRDLESWHCIIVGEPQSGEERVYAADLRRLARSLGIEGRVTFAGFRRDVGRILAAADVYCQPNTGADAFGLSFAEALGAGLPVVTSPLGAAAELLGDSGVLVQDDAELATELRALVESAEHRRSLSHAARERWQVIADPTRQIPALEAVLERAAD